VVVRVFRSGARLRIPSGPDDVCMGSVGGVACIRTHVGSDVQGNVGT